MNQEWFFEQCSFCGHFGKVHIDEFGMPCVEVAARAAMLVHERHCSSNPNREGFENVVVSTPHVGVILHNSGLDA